MDLNSKTHPLHSDHQEIASYWVSISVRMLAAIRFPGPRDRQGDRERLGAVNTGQPATLQIWECRLNGKGADIRNETRRRDPNRFFVHLHDRRLSQGCNKGLASILQYGCWPHVIGFLFLVFFVLQYTNDSPYLISAVPSI